MKKSTICALMFGIAMGVLWCGVFTNVLHSPAGIGVGIALGAAFFSMGRLMFSYLDK